MRTLSLLLFFATACSAATPSVTQPDQIKVPPGFKVELLREAAPGEGSWICMAQDEKGRLYLSPQGAVPGSSFAKDSKWGGLWRVTLKDVSTKNTEDTKGVTTKGAKSAKANNGGGNTSDVQPEKIRNQKSEIRNFPSARPGEILNPKSQILNWDRVPVPVGDCMGMLWAFNSLYVSGEGPQGRGIYRCTSSKHDDQLDTATLFKAIPGGAGEHGAHAIVLGPDKKHLYIMNGNATPILDGLAPDSPYRNWGEDDLLPRLKDPVATFFDKIKAPYGCVYRTDENGTKWELFAGGLRNPYDLAFNPDGELFTYDADMEWDRGLPWYRPTRILHLVPGGEYGFREGSAKWPAWYPDSLPAVCDIGLGCPTGIKFGTDAKGWPEKYRRALFLHDWTFGRILAVQLHEKGASYTARNDLASYSYPKDAEANGDVEVFLSGKGMPVTDMEFLKDGSMVFTTGGRGTASGLYRVSYVGKGDPVVKDHISPLKAELKKAHEERWSAFQADSWSIERYWRAQSQVESLLKQIKEAAPNTGANPPLEEENSFLVEYGGKLLRRVLDRHPPLRIGDMTVARGIEDPLHFDYSGQWPKYGDYFALHWMRQNYHHLWEKAEDSLLTEVFELFAKDADKTDASHDIRAAILPWHLEIPRLAPAKFQANLLHALEAKSFGLDSLNSDLKLLKLRVLEVSFARQGRPSAAAVKALVEELSREYPAKGSGAPSVPAATTPNGAAALPNEATHGKDGAARGSNVAGETRGAPKDGAVRAGDMAGEDARRSMLNRELSQLLIWLTNPELGELNAELAAKAGRAPWSAAGSDSATPLSEGKRSGAEQPPTGDKPPTTAPASKSGVALTLATALQGPVPNPGASVFPGRKGDAALTAAGREVIEKTLALMDAAPSQEEQISYALALRWADGWSPEQRVRYFRWFHEKAARYTGGNSFAKFVEAIRADAESRVPESERAALSQWLRPVAAPTPAAALKPRALVKAWTLPELEAALDALKDRQPDLARGKELYTQAQCAQCHLFRDAGGNVGPDLTAVAQRFGRHDILESITDPSKVVSDQYAMVTLTVLDGQGGTKEVSGLIKEETSATITLLTDPLAGKTSHFYTNVVTKREKAAVSTMPPGLLYTLTAEEVADLLALFGAK